MFNKGARIKRNFYVSRISPRFLTFIFDWVSFWFNSTFFPFIKLTNESLLVLRDIGILPGVHRANSG